MRTTIRLAGHLIRVAKRRARETARSLTQLIEDCLQAELQRPARARSGQKPLPTYSGKGLLPEVDLTGSSALDDVMTGR